MLHVIHVYIHQDKFVVHINEVILILKHSIFSGIELIWNGLMHIGNVYRDLTESTFQMFIKKMDVVLSAAKEKRTIQTVQKPVSVVVWWILVGNLHICESTINGEHILEQ